MCEPLVPLDELESLKFSVIALAQGHENGSFKERLANGCGQRYKNEARLVHTATQGRW